MCLLLYLPNDVRLLIYHEVHRYLVRCCVWELFQAYEWDDTYNRYVFTEPEKSEDITYVFNYRLYKRQFDGRIYRVSPSKQHVTNTGYFLPKNWTIRC